MSAQPPPGATPRDPGLQGERTSLAWNRTGLSLAVNAVLALRTGWADGHPILTVVGVILLLAAGAAIAYGNFRGRALSGFTAHVPPAAPSLAIGLAALFALVACAAGIASVLVVR